MLQLHMFVPVFTEVQELVNHANKVGSPFFSPKAMQYFRTKLPDPMVYGGKYFITKENSRLSFSDGAYLIRKVEPQIDGWVNIRTMCLEGMPDGYKTLREARNVVKYFLMTGI